MLRAEEAQKQEEIVKPYVLLVEGKDDRAFFHKLFEELGVTDIQIFIYNGNGKLNKFLESFSRDRGFKKISRMGVVGDADNRAVYSYNCAKRALNNSALPAHDDFGQFTTNPPLSVGIFMFPEEGEIGMLETLLLNTLRDDDVVLIEAKIYIEKLREVLADSFPRNVHKATYGVYSSGMKKYGANVETMAQKGYIDFDAQELDGIKEFIIDLRTP